MMPYGLQPSPYPMISNKEIVDQNVPLIKKCINYQFKRNAALSGDFFSDLYLILCDYDNEKLNDAYNNNHLNALITRIIINNLHSNTSQYYRQYRKFLSKTDDIQNLINDEDTDETSTGNRPFKGQRYDSED